MNVENSWVVAWSNSIGLPSETPEWIYALFALICTYCLVIVPSAGLMAYCDRKLSADLQARVGPNRAGPAGLLQPLADLLKHLQKDVRSEWNWRESIWLGVHTMALYSTLAVMPL